MGNFRYHVGYAFYIVFIVCVGGTKQEKCSQFFSSFVELRESLLKVPDYEQANEILAITEVSFGMDIEADSDWKHLACQISEVNNIVELSEVIGLPVHNVQEVLLDIKEYYVVTKVDFRGFASALRGMAAWAETAGFPFNFPLHTTWEETYSVMLKAHEYNLAHFLTMGAPSFPVGLTNSLTESKSLDEFLLDIGSELTTGSPRFTAMLAKSQQMINPKKAENVLVATKALLNFIETMQSIGILQMNDIRGFSKK